MFVFLLFFVAVLEVRDCVSMDAISLNDLFVTLSLGGAESRTTVKNECGSEAVFSEAFQLYDLCFIGFYFCVEKNILHFIHEPLVIRLLS